METLWDLLSRSLFTRLILQKHSRNQRKRIDWSLQNHIGNYCNQFEFIGQTNLPVASCIPTLNPEEPTAFPLLSRAPIG